MTLLMFLTPVLYPLSAVPPKLSFLIWANPLAYVFEAARSVLLAGTLPSLPVLAALNLGGVAVASVGYMLFRHREWEYADVV